MSTPLIALLGFGALLLVLVVVRGSGRREGPGPPGRKTGSGCGAMLVGLVLGVGITVAGADHFIDAQKEKVRAELTEDG